MEKSKENLEKNPKELLLQEFKEKLNKESESEIEIKVVSKTKDREEINEQHKEIQKKIFSSFSNVKTIFDWVLVDTRYDTEERWFKKQWVNVIRIREEIQNNNESNFVYTLKSMDENRNSFEAENNLSEEEKEELLKKFNEWWIKEFKKTTKKRKEFKFDIFLRKEWKKLSIKKEVKIAFDEYTDEDNCHHLPFFEIESDDEEAVKETLKILKLDKSEYKITKSWMSAKEKEEGKIAGLEEIESKKLTKNKHNFKKILYLLLSEESIYSEISEYLNWEKNSISEDKTYKHFEKFIKKVLFKNIRKIISKDPDYKLFFYRIIKFEWDKILEWKKFNQKFEREYSWYIKALASTILKEFKQTNYSEINKEREKKITPEIQFRDIIRKKTDLFLKSLFLFDDNLTKEELEDFLDKSNEAINTKYELFSSRLLQIFKSLSIKNKDYENIEETLNIFADIYKTWIRWVGYEKKEILEWADIIKENIWKTIGELLRFLSYNFSIWLNTPNAKSKDENYKDEKYLYLKKSFKDVLLFINLFSEINVAFSNELKCKNFWIGQIDDLQSIFSEEIFDSNNFIEKDLEKELLKDFLQNIFHSEDEDCNDVFRIKEKYDRFYDEDLLFILSKNKNTFFNEGEFLEKFEKAGSQKKKELINYKSWENLSQDNRLKIFLTDILQKNNDNEGYSFNENIFNKNIDNEYFEEFVNEEFKKKFLVDNIPEEKSTLFHTYKNYKEDTLQQFKKSIDDFENIKNEVVLLDYIEHNVNNFHLIVTWFHFNLRKEYSISENKEMDKLELKTLNFTEAVVEELQDRWLIDIDNNKIVNKLWAKLRTRSSDSYNSSGWDVDLMDKLFKRIANWKPINLEKSYSFKDEKWTKIYLKNLKHLYIPKWKINENSLEKIREYTDSWLSLVRKLMNWEKWKLEDNEKKYLNALKSYWFPIKKWKYNKKLLEFLKFIKKETFSFMQKQHNNSDQDTKFIKEKFDNDEFAENIWTNNNNIIIPWTKSLVRWTEKWVSKYWWQYEKIWDKTRMTILWEDITDLKTVMANFIQKVWKMDEVEEILLEDKIWNIFKKAKRQNGYRDAKITLALNNWNNVEVQFQLRDYFDVKHNWTKIEGELEEKLQPKDKYDKRRIDFSKEEKEKIFNFCENASEKIPRDFARLFLAIEDDELKDNNIFWWEEDYLSADFTYRIERAIQDRWIIDKLNELDRRLFDEIAWWKIAKKEIERIMEK